MRGASTIDKGHPPLTCIRSFESAARHLNFTRAAAELGYTQAAISTHVKALEHYLGAALFHRRARSLALTEAGSAYLPTVRQALSMIDGATEMVRIGTQSRTVTLSCPMSLAENWLSRRLAGFRHVRPDIDLVVQGTIWDVPVEGGGADLVISMCRDDEIPRGGHRLLQETLGLYCAPEIARGIASTPDLLGLPRILVLGRQEFWTAFEPELGRDLMGAGRAIRTNAMNIALEMAAHGMGAVAAPVDLAQVYVARGLLVEPRAVRTRSRWVYVLTDASRQPTAATDQVMTWLLRESRAADDPPDG